MSDDRHPVPKGYEFIRLLGAGGHGEVVLARHRALGREVAIKRILARHVSDEQASERFRREAKVLASTSSPTVVKVYDLIREDTAAYLVMEHVMGSSLSEILDGGPVPAADALPILRDVAEALAVMQARGVVHRDVKPGNVFVLTDGSAKLGDFGLARVVNDASIFRTAGPSDLGTPAYFPPEVSQDGAEPDSRSDAYSFAVMAYEVLTGRLPFTAPNPMSMITAHWLREPTEPREHLPGFPDAAWTALRSGLAKDPSLRSSPTDLVDQLAVVPADAWPAVERAVAVATGARRTVAPAVRPVPKLPRSRWPARRVLSIALPVTLALVLLAVELLSGRG